ncbi:MAG: SycD/LcrH family type III secretion system chaperone [Chlamydiales bacterium]
MLEESSFQNVDQTTLVNQADDKIDEMHSMAYVYYQNKHYQEADALFRILVVIAPQNYKYWKGLGACLQMKKNYKDALNCYRCAQALLKEKPDPYLDVHTADCHFALKQIEEGLKALERAKSTAKKQPNQAILQHVSFMRERWNNKRTGGG